MQKEMVSLAQRETLLRTIPLFRNWGVSELSTLVGLLKEVYVDVGKNIVSEGALIDAIYFLVSGSAEINKQLDVNGKIGVTFLGLLNPGEAIGLKDTGLFSETGERTATIKAITPCVVLKLDLNDFHHILKKHPQLEKAIDNSISGMLKIQMIKNAAPFAQLSNQRLAWMGNLVKELSIKAKTIIFKEGDITDACYMIYEGQVEILKNVDGEENILTVLEPGTLFGEAALLSSEKRNATARTSVDSKLLVMDKDMLRELTSQDGIASDVLMSLVMNRSRPLRHSNIIYQQRTMSDGHLITLLKDSGNNSYYQLNETGWYIWQLLNGTLTLPEITKQVQLKFTSCTPEEVHETVERLIEKGFVQMDALSTTDATQINRDNRKQFKFSYFFKKSDQKINFLYRYGGFIFFLMPVTIAIILASIISFPLFLKITGNMMQSVNQVNILPVWIIVALILSRFLLLFSPLTKALAIKHFKHHIPQVGILWKLSGPQIYLDSSDIIMSGRWQRIAVILSGIIALLFIASLLTVYIYLYNKTSIIIWLCVLFIYMEILRNLNPMMDLDGYQILTESLNTSDLRESAIRWITGWYRTHTIKNKKYVIIFWMYALLYLLLLLITAILFMQLFITVLPAIDKVYSLVLCLIIISYLFEIALEIRRQRKINHLVEMV